MTKSMTLLNVYDQHVYEHKDGERARDLGPFPKPGIAGIGAVEKLGILGRESALVALFREGDHLLLKIGSNEFPCASHMRTQMNRWIPGFKRFVVFHNDSRALAIWYSPRTVDGDDLMETIHRILESKQSIQEVMAKWAPAV